MDFKPGNQPTSWSEAIRKWDEGAEKAAQIKPIKKLNVLPEMKGITDDTAKHLKWKAFKWIVFKDHQRKILKSFFKHPFKYGWGYLCSIFQKKSYQREGDFFLYGVDSLKQFNRELKKKNRLFVIGFSYCHKPFECPSGRFTASCIHDPDNLVCRQCFIGKAVNALPKGSDIQPLFIPTVHYIGEKIFEIVHANPTKNVVFLITACEMTLEMFGDLGNMVGIKGIGVRLDGRICNTMKAFELSERGIKPGLTVVLDQTQEKIMQIIHSLHSF